MLYRRIWFASAGATAGLALAAVSLAAAPATPSTASVSGDVHSPGVWDTVRIQRELKADVKLVHYTLKGQSHTADCVPLLSLVDAAQPAVNSRIKHHDLQFVVSVQGFDGYTVDFSMAELQPELGNRAVWIALDEDGKPLSDDEGAFDILAPDDVKPARWVHGVTAITVIDCSKVPAGS